MMTHHPAFDCRTATWFIAGRREEAKSLALLKAKLGAGHKLLGYYPHGYNGKVIYSKEQTRKVISQSHRSVQLAPAKPKEKIIIGAVVTRKAPVRASSFVDWNANNVQKLRELVAKGWAPTRIGNAFGCSRNAIIGKRNRLGI